MNELDRDVLGIGRVRAAAECQQSAAAQKTLRHFAARERQARGFGGEERLAELVALEQSVSTLSSTHIR